MNRREHERRAHLERALISLGFTQDECDKLRRISMTLQRWHELECGDGNGHIERDEKTGTPRYFNSRARYVDPQDPRAWHVIPDREKGAHKRLQYIVHSRNCRVTQGSNGEQPKDLHTFIQTDPRGAALYILRPGDVPAGQSADAYYTRGICVY